MRKPLAYDGDIVFNTGDPGSSFGAGTVQRFNGSSRSTIASNIYDHAVGPDGKLYLLRTDGRITVDGVTVTTAPTGARSLLVIDGAIYVGTATSHLWRLDR